MKVLWFSITPSLYFGNSMMGSWVEALERIVRKRSDVQLSIAFQSTRPLPEKSEGNVSYYPMYQKRSRFEERYIDDYTYRFTDRFLMQRGMEIIEKVKPDVIHVFGSEWSFGLLAEKTNIPVVIHVQGIWLASKHIIEEQTSTKGLWDYMHDEYRPQMWWSFLRKRHKMKERAVREEKILAANRYFMGRTRWDKALTRLLSPNSQYFYCSEALRNAFVECKQRWKYVEHEKFVLMTVGNNDMAKGYPLILQTAKLLKEHAQFEVEWHLLGIRPQDFNYLYRKYGIRYDEVGLIPHGAQPAEAIVVQMLQSDLFVQASITDNSPNAVCEAQYLGMPVVFTNVGGVASLFSNQEMGVPLHDPYYLAGKLIELYQNREMLQSVADENYQVAHARHDDQSIARDLFACYQTLITHEE